MHLVNNNMMANNQATHRLHFSSLSTSAAGLPGQPFHKIIAINFISLIHSSLLPSFAQTETSSSYYYWLLPFHPPSEPP